MALDDAHLDRVGWIRLPGYSTKDTPKVTIKREKREVILWQLGVTPRARVRDHPDNYLHVFAKTHVHPDILVLSTDGPNVGIRYAQAMEKLRTDPWGIARPVPCFI